MTTDDRVTYLACPTCFAEAGEPCRTTRGGVRVTHANRHAYVPRALRRSTRPLPPSARAVHARETIVREHRALVARLDAAQGAVAAHDWTAAIPLLKDALRSAQRARAATMRLRRAYESKDR